MDKHVSEGKTMIFVDSLGVGDAAPQKLSGTPEDAVLLLPGGFIGFPAATSPC